MKNFWNVAIVIGLLVAVAVVFKLKQPEADPGDTSACSPGFESATSCVVDPNAPPATCARPTVALPRLLDLGAGECVPCKMMAPILEELREEYQGELSVDFIDVSKDRAAAELHGVQKIPTQIFFDADGEELFRHEGFMAKEAILAKWKELGVELNAAAPQEE